MARHRRGQPRAPGAGGKEKQRQTKSASVGVGVESFGSEARAVLRFEGCVVTLELEANFTEAPLAFLNVSGFYFTPTRDQCGHRQIHT